MYLYNTFFLFCKAVGQAEILLNVANAQMAVSINTFLPLSGAIFTFFLQSGDYLWTNPSTISVVNIGAFAFMSDIATILPNGRVQVGCEKTRSVKWVVEASLEWTGLG